MSSDQIHSQEEEVSEVDYFDTVHNDTPDNSIWGDIMKPKDNTILRLYFQNVNGLSTTDLVEEWIDILHQMEKIGADIYGLAETNIKWTPSVKSMLYSKLRHNVSKQRNLLKLTTASCDDPAYGLYQPGGVCQVIHGTAAGRVGLSGEDGHGLGRWVYATLQGKDGRKLVVVTLYCLSQVYQPLGWKTAYNQQYRHMRRKGEINPKPHQQLYSDLLQQIEIWSRDSEIIIMADANASLNEKHWSAFMTKANLYDVLGMKHGYNSPRTYIRGQKTIDFILATEGVLNSVMAAGMLPFQHGIISDHRGLWIDLNIASLLKGAIPPQQSKPVSIIPTTKQKDRCKKLRIAITKEIQARGLYAKINDLTLDSTSSVQDLINNMNKYDTELTEAILSCLDQLKPQWPFWWSKEIHHYYLLTKYWRIKQNEIVLGTNFATQLVSLRTDLPSDFDIYMGCPQLSIKSLLRKAKQHLKQLRANSFQKRQDELVNLTQIDSNTNTTDARVARKKKNRLAAIAQSERQQRVHAKIRRYLKPQTKQGLTHIDVPSEDGGIKRLVLKDDMEKALFRHHSTHFGQAEGTPFTRDNIVNFFGYNGDTDQAKDFRQGIKGIVPTISGIEYEQKYMEHLVPNAIDPPTICTTITVADVKKGFSIWKERTSTSPLGRVLSLYKMWLNVKDEDANEDGTFTATEFFEMITNLINVSQKVNTPLDRWKTVHNLFILKEPNNFNISRLRTIHKIDAELNLVRRELISRRLLRQAEKLKFLDDNSYGGRNGRCAIDAVMKKHFTLQAMHLERRNGALTDCDAKACYDRVIPLVLYLSYSKAGLPHNACVWLCKALTQMKYHITTAQGISETFTETTAHRKIYGVGQGATDAPTGWLFVSTTVSKMHDKYATGCSIQDPTKTIIVTWTHVIFVDDTYLMHCLSSPTASIKEIKAAVEQDVNKWNSGIHTTGGKLEPSKTKYYILFWAFREDGTPFLQDSTTDNTKVYLTTGEYTEELIQIQHDREPKEFKSLGTRVPGTLEDAYEYNVAVKKVEKFSRFLTACPLRRHETWIAYKQYLLPSLLYGTVVTSFTADQVEKLQQKFHPKLLQKLGFKASLPRAIAMAPKSSGGVGLTDLKLASMQQKILFILRHVRSNTSIGQLFLIVMRWAQLQAGFGDSILGHTLDIPHLESEWICDLRNGLWKINAQIWLNDAWELKRQRHHDVFLMEQFVGSKLTTRDLKLLNYCRLYLRVLRLSDITSTDGTRILPQYWKGLSRSTQSTLMWPVQPKPGIIAWKVWQRELKKLCRYSNRLRSPLGPWRQLNHFTSDWMYDSSSTIVIHKESGTIRHYKAIEKRKRITIDMSRPIPVNSSITAHIPLLDLRCKGQVGTCSVGTKEHIVDWDESWNQNLTRSSMAELSREIMPKQMPTGIPPMIRIQLEDKLWVVTDGGVYDGKGYFGWVMATSDQIIYEHAGTVPGNQEEMDSTRAESGGLLNALMFLTQIWRERTTKVDTNVDHFCDNLIVTSRVQKFLEYYNWYPNQTTDAHMDIQLEISYYLEQLNLTLSSNHVKGHQNKSKSATLLSWEEKLNVRADQLATFMRLKLERKGVSQEICMPHSRINLFINNKLITKRFGRAMMRAWTTQDLRVYLENKYNWGSTICDELDWFALDRAFHRLPLTKQTWVTKFIHHWLPLLGEKHNSITETLCPVCGTYNETWKHHIECKDNEHTHDNLADTVLQSICKEDVDPYLRTLLRRALCHQPNTMAALKDLNFPIKVYKLLIDHQNSIGWNLIHFGRFSLHWDRFQRKYLHSIGKSIPGTEPAWIQRTIMTIYLQHHQRWEARNKRLHANEVDHCTKNILLHRIQGLYKYQQTLLTQDQGCFERPLHEWNDRPAHELRAWLTTHEKHIRICSQQRAIHESQHTSDLRSYGFSAYTTRGIRLKQPRYNCRPVPISNRITSYITRKRRVAKTTRGSDDDMVDSSGIDGHNIIASTVQTSILKYVRKESWNRTIRTQENNSTTIYSTHVQPVGDKIHNETQKQINTQSDERLGDNTLRTKQRAPNNLSLTGMQSTIRQNTRMQPRQTERIPVETHFCDGGKRKKREYKRSHPP